MIPRGICSVFSTRSIYTSPLFASKVYKTTRERPLISMYKVRNKLLRMEAAQPGDVPLIVDFMSEILAQHKPACGSIGVTAEEARPFVEKICENSLPYSFIFVDEDNRVVAGGIANTAELDRSKAIKPMIREEYGEIIDSLKEWIPSRKMRQVVAPACDLINMSSHYLPKDVDKILRYKLCCVHKSVLRGNVVRKMIYELAIMGTRDGIKFGDTQTTARATYRSHSKTGSKDVFMIPYDRMYDYGKRIYPKVPLKDGSPGLNLFILDLESLTKKAKC